MCPSKPRSLQPGSGEAGTFQFRVAEVGAFETGTLEYRLSRCGGEEDRVSCYRTPQGRPRQVGVEQVCLTEINRYCRAGFGRLPIPVTALPPMTQAPTNEQP